MPGPSPLPADLAGRPFTVAEALERGVSRKVLRGQRLRAPFRGVRVPVLLPDDLPTRCAAAQLILPGDARFSHTTAALLHGLPLPSRAVHGPLHVTSAACAARIAGVVAHRAPGTPAHVWRHGLAVSTPSCTWAELAELFDVDDLVVAGDHLLHQGLAARPALADVGARSGRRGVRRLQQALPLLDGGSDSPMETRLRLLLVRAGLPVPCVGRDVVEDGAWLARPDLSYPLQRIAIEYEGDHHRTDRRQWKRDKGRRRLLEDHGWLVIEVVDDDVYKTPDLTVGRVRAALTARTY